VPLDASLKRHYQRAVQRDEFLRELCRHVQPTIPGPWRIGIDGVDASGKSTLADELADRIAIAGDRPVVRSSIDGFHMERAHRYRRGRESAEGYYRDSFNLDALCREILEPLGPGGSRAIRRAVFDHTTDSPCEVEQETASEETILVLDGVFLGMPRVAAHLDMMIYLSCSFPEVIRRARRRDAIALGGADEAERVYRVRYIPGQQIYIRECAPALAAGLVVDNTDPEFPRLCTRTIQRRRVHRQSLTFRPRVGGETP
jgi:uridine kinase